MHKHSQHWRRGKHATKTEKENWYHCRSEENPADIITRNNSDPNSSLWWHGPTFLCRDSLTIDKFDADNCLLDHPGFIDEIPNSKLSLHASMITNMSIGNIINIQRYNDLLKLFRITAYVLRFTRNLKAKVNKESLCLNKYVISSELRDAKLRWVKDNQIGLNTEVYDDLKLNLNLKTDESGVVRSYSRLKNAKIPFDTKATIIVNQKHKLAELIVYYSHLKVLHRGVKQTLTEIRSNYWITRGRSYVKKLLH